MILLINIIEANQFVNDPELGKTVKKLNKNEISKYIV